MANNKENTHYDENKNRLRGDNWSQEEKDLFMEIMEQSSSIIENKLTDTNTNKRKNLEWQKIQSKLKELTGKPRDIPQLKGFWRRSKITAKKTVSLHRRALNATGGGQKPPSPPLIDLKIMELCPTDFVNEENKFDSDAVSLINVQDDAAFTVNDGAHNSTIYDMDINEDTSYDAEVSFVDEIVTVADVHDVNPKVDIKSCRGEKENKIKLETLLNIKQKEMIQGKKKNSKNSSSKAALIETN